MVTNYYPYAVARTASALVCVLGLGGCDYMYLHYADCRYYDGAQFDTLLMNRPVLNQEYNEQVSVYFDDDRRIENYVYGFEFTGSLPPGLSYYQNQNNIIFAGTAISLGTYAITITVDTRYATSDSFLLYDSDYCSYRTTQNFLVTVDPI